MRFHTTLINQFQRNRVSMEIEAVERQVGAEVLLMQLHRGAPLLHEDAPGFVGRGFWLESRTSL